MAHLVDFGRKEGKAMYDSFDAFVKIATLLIALVDLFLRLSDRSKKN